MVKWKILQRGYKMQHISEIIEDILVEWAYRVHDGMPNPKNTQHIQELRESMEELNLPNNVIYQVIQNLIEGRKKRKSGDVWKTKTGWAGKKSEDETQYGMKDKVTAKKYVSGEEVPTDDKPTDDKKDDTDETSKVSKTLLQAPPEKESTSARNKRRQQINEETDKIIKESKGDMQVVSNLIN